MTYIEVRTQEDRAPLRQLIEAASAELVFHNNRSYVKIEDYLMDDQDQPYQDITLVWEVLADLRSLLQVLSYDLEAYNDSDHVEVVRYPAMVTLEDVEMLPTV